MTEIVIFLCFDSYAYLHFITCCKMFTSSRPTDGSVFFRTSFTTLTFFPGSGPNSTESDGGDEITLREMIEREQEKQELTFVTHVREMFLTVLVNPFSVDCASTGVYVVGVR